MGLVQVDHVHIINSTPTNPVHKALLEQCGDAVAHVEARDLSEEGVSLLAMALDVIDVETIVLNVGDGDVIIGFINQKGQVKHPEFE